MRGTRLLSEPIYIYISKSINISIDNVYFNSSRSLVKQKGIKDPGNIDGCKRCTCSNRDIPTFE